MSKSILMIDTPESCFECLLFQDGIYETCAMTNKGIQDEPDGMNDERDKPEWCPLKPMPEYEVNNDPENEYHKRWVNGYNAFLRYLNGEEE